MKKFIFFFFVWVIVLDAGAQMSPESYTAKWPVSWISEGIIYQVWLRSFTREGTLKAAAKRLPFIAELGATIIYLSPVMLADTTTDRKYWSPRQKSSPGQEARNPYKTMDYSKIDPEYGTEEDLKEFIATAHQLGLRVMMDMVYMHTGPSCNLTKDPDNYERDNNGKFLLNDYNFLELNFKNKRLREYLINDMNRWLTEFRADGFRCDVSGGIPVDFWEEARAYLQERHPDIGMLGESNRPADEIKAFDVCYGFPWYDELKKVAVGGLAASALQVRWEHQKDTFPKGALFIRYTDNHDQRRTDFVFGEKCSRTLNALNFMLDGVPFIYNGQEIGDGSPFGIFEHWPILWESQGLPDKTELRNWYKKIIQLRKSEPLLRNGKTVWLATDKPESVVAFVRKSEKGEIVCIFNLSNRDQEVTIRMPESKIGEYRSLLSDVKTVAEKNNVLKVSMAGFGYFIGK